MISFSLPFYKNKCLNPTIINRYGVQAFVRVNRFE